MIYKHRNPNRSRFGFLCCRYLDLVAFFGAFEAALVLNLSTRPAVSSDFSLPV